MNIAIVTEGRGDKYLYKTWIPYINPNISYVDFFHEITNNNFSIISSKGWPYYLKTIDDAIEDANLHGNIDRLVLSVDSEDQTLQEKCSEISNHIINKPCSASIYIIIQHFCIETWALGNKSICPVNPNYQPLIAVKNFFDVRSLDPELLPPYPPQLNRAQFAEKYLHLILKARNTHLTYNKSHPKPLRNKSYFNQIVKRYQTTHHITSFAAFLSAFT